MKDNDKGMSSLQKDINRLRKRCKELNDSNTLRKHQIKQFDAFIKVLIKDGRINKEEIAKFMSKKDVTKINALL
jgi:polyhydroxyalkanoate synthesis regulator phasin